MGGIGSGNYGHLGRKGHQGGSLTADPAVREQRKRFASEDRITEILEKAEPICRHIVYRKVRRPGLTESDAEDLLAVARTAVWKAAASYTKGKGTVLTSWIHTVVNSKVENAAKSLARQARLPNLPLVTEEGETHTIDPEDTRVPSPVVEAAKEHARARLSGQELEVFLLRLDGYGFGEIAAFLGADVPESRIRGIFRSARGRLDPEAIFG